MRTIWTGLETPSLEHLVLQECRGGFRAESDYIGAAGGMPVKAHFVMDLLPDWRMGRLVASAWAGSDERRLELWRDTAKGWMGAGGPLPDLAGCEYVDIAWTPFTNTLPIRSLALAPGERQEVRVVYVSFPDLAVRSVGQRYTCLAPDRWLYESLASGYRAELTVDAHGAVVEYPGLFRRIATAS